MYKIKSSSAALFIACSLTSAACLADCKSDPAKIYVVGKVMESSVLSNLTDAECTGVRYSLEQIMTMDYKGSQYFVATEKLNFTGPAMYKIISVKRGGAMTPPATFNPEKFKKDVKSIDIAKGTVKVDMSHDEFLQLAPHNATLSQVVTKNPQNGSLLISKHVKADNKEFSVTLTKPVIEGPYRIISIRVH